MKILYITSGHLFYPHKFLDNFITAALNSISQHQVQVYEVNVYSDWQPRLFALMQSFKPDFVFSIHGSNFSPQLVQKLKSYGARVGMWFVDDPYDIDSSKQRLFGYDFVITTERNCVPYYYRAGVAKAFYVRFGTEKQYYFPEEVIEHYKSDICFLGSPFPGRIELVKSVAEKFPGKRFWLVGPNWGRYIKGNVVCFNNPVEPTSARKFYCGARINLNIHRGSAEQLYGQSLNREGITPSIPNVRTFDIAACKAFQLVDYKPGLEECFDLGRELITFTDRRDLLEKIDYYLHHPEKCREIAELAYRRTINQYRLEDSLIYLFTIVEREMSLEQKAMPRAEVQKAGFLVRGDKRPAVYWVFGGTKHEFPSREMFNRLKLNWDDIQLWRQEDIDQIPSGMPIVEGDMR